jgi:hypothetical protein
MPFDAPFSTQLTIAEQHYAETFTWNFIRLATKMYKITRRFYLCLISVFYREVDEICDLLGCNAEYGGNFLSGFRHNISVLFSRETIFDSWRRNWQVSLNSENNYLHTLRNITEGRRSSFMPFNTLELSLHRFLPNSKFLQILRKSLLHRSSNKPSKKYDYCA